MSWFFMSYARCDDEHRELSLVQMLFHDLAETVASKTVGVTPPGYLDQAHLKPGEQWPDELTRAIRCARTFVPIMTARYFQREMCGREWGMFDQRCQAYARSTGVEAAPPLILPVLWVPPRDVEFPSFVKSIQFQIPLDQVALEERRRIKDYAKLGLLWVLKRRASTHGNAYETIIEQLADTIIRAAADHPLDEFPERSLPDLMNVAPRFAAGRSLPSIPASPSNRATFVFVAPRSDELEGSVEAYGPSSSDWKPFHPESQEPIALIAQREATSRELICDWLPVDDKLVNKLRKAEEEASVAIVVVDPCSLKLDRYRSELERFDQYQFANTAVLIAWNQTAFPSEQRRAAVREDVTTSLRRRFAQRSTLLRDDISSASDLETQLRLALQDLEEIVALLRSPSRPVPTGRYASPPAVETRPGTS